jgi:hypothetical protein
MIAIGADVHKRMCTLAAQDEEGRLEMLPSMENTRENGLHRVEGLPAEAELALEVSTRGYLVMSVWEEAGGRERARGGPHRRDRHSAPAEVRPPGCPDAGRGSCRWPMGIRCRRPGCRRPRYASCAGGRATVAG